MEVNEGNIINLTFTSFEVEFDPFSDCGFDYVEVSYESFSEKICGIKYKPFSFIREGFNKKMWETSSEV